ncbi:MAG: hypothetical protein AAGI30_02235 [Planctomycetota bacterium]
MPAAPADRPDIDLRRRTVRKHAELILERARWLMPTDRAVIEAVYRDGFSVAHLADLHGSPPRSTRRRVRQTVAAVMSVEFDFVLRHRDTWPPIRRRVATACILQGRAMRDASRHLKLSLHTVRTELGIIRALIESEAPAARRAG